MEQGLKIELQTVGTFLLLFLILSWYTTINQEKVFSKEDKTTLKYSEVMENIGHYDVNKNYYHKIEYDIVRTKTWIPFRYKRENISTVVSGYYSIDKE